MDIHEVMRQANKEFQEGRVTLRPFTLFEDVHKERRQFLPNKDCVGTCKFSVSL